MRLPLTADCPASAQNRTRRQPTDDSRQLDEERRKAAIGRQMCALSHVLLFCSHIFFFYFYIEKLPTGIFCFQLPTGLSSLCFSCSFALIDSPKLRCHCGGVAAAVAAKAAVGFCTPTRGGDADANGDVDWSLCVFVLDGARVRVVVNWLLLLLLPATAVGGDCCAHFQPTRWRARLTPTLLSLGFFSIFLFCFFFCCLLLAKRMLLLVPGPNGAPTRLLLLATYDTLLLLSVCVIVCVCFTRPQ